MKLLLIKKKIILVFALMVHNYHLVIKNKIDINVYHVLKMGYVKVGILQLIQNK